MRIYQITAGAADMYCGSCIRDNALAAELLAQGHQVLLIPVYTPTLTDELNVSQQRVFFGGISVYLEQKIPLFRRTPRWLDWLWDATPVLRVLSRLSIRTDPRQLGEMTVSMLRGEDGYQQKEFSKLLDWLRAQPQPDVVVLANALLIGMAAPIRRELGCAVICTMQGEDLFLEGLEQPYRSQALDLIRARVGTVDVFVAVSQYYAQFMGDYLQIPEEKIRVVPLGINLQGYPAAEELAPPADRPFTIGYFARITPEKGLQTLCEAYRLLRSERGLPPGRIEAAGYLGHEHKSYLRTVERKMESWGLADEFHYRGVLDREQKISFLRGLDVLSVPSSYAEPKGVYLLEAMACGVPVVQPHHGAFPEILAKTGGILYEPHDAAGLAAALAELWNDPARRRVLGQQAHAAVREHFSVAREAARALEVYAHAATAREHIPAAAAK